MEEKKENIKAYGEACNMIRHYSNMSFTIRTIAIVQGIALIAGWLISCDKDVVIGMFLTPILGVFLTWSLYRFYMSYYDTISFFYEITGKMEDTLFDEKFRPVKLYNKDHKSKYSNRLNKLIRLDAAFLLIGGTFLVILVISIVKFTCCQHAGVCL